MDEQYQKKKSEEVRPSSRASRDGNGGHHHHHHHHQSTTEEESSPRKKDGFRMGEKVEAKKNNETTYRLGQIVARHRNGTYDVAFDQGGEALEIPPTSIRRLDEEENSETDTKSKSSQVRASSPTRANGPKADQQVSEASATNRNNANNKKTKFKVGEQVEAQREGKSTYRFAVIAKVNDDGTYDVVYSDRFRENGVSEDKIERAFADTDGTKTKTQTQSSNDEEEMNTKSRTEEAVVAPTRSKSPERPQTAPKSASKEETGDRRFKVGMEIEAKYDGGMMYYPGKILSIDYGERIACIQYDDGDKEDNVSLDLMKLVNEATPKRPVRRSGDEPRIKFPIGSKVEGNYKGTGKWYPGVIHDIRNEDGEYIYSVHYNDGDIDDNMTEDLVREPKPKAAKAPRQVGSGQTSADEKKSPLQARRIVKASSNNPPSSSSDGPITASPPSKKASNTLDDILRVEANFRGLGEWFPGRIVRDRKDGTVDVDYDDGDKETCIPLDRIRPLRGTNAGITSPAAVSSNTTNNNEPHPFKVGDKVEGNFQNAGQYYPGKVTRLKTDDITGFHYVDITYDDGDQEKGVPINRVRKLSANKKATAPSQQSSPTTSSGQKKLRNKQRSLDLSVDGGALIEVQDLDKKWYMGRILSANEVQQVADVRLLNGEVRSKVPFQKIRLPRTQTTVDFGVQNTRASSPSKQGNGQQANSDIALALNVNDLEALKLLLKQKDDEILRLRQKVRQLESQQQSQNSQQGNGSGSVKNNNEITQDIVALKKANNELRTSITFLGEKFALVIDELVNVKKKEEKLSKQVKQQGEELQRIYGGR